MNTVGEALSKARTYETITPMEAQVTLGLILERERPWLIAHPEAPLSEEEAQQYDEVLERLAAGEPLAYLTGMREFHGLPFLVSPDVLVPRPDTEVLVDAVLEWAHEQQKRPLSIIDVGTGSGIIALTLAWELDDCDVVATDISERALFVAGTNVFRLSVPVVLVHSDLLANVEGPFDVIAANLPYIARPDLADLSVAKWEPILALDGGEDGLDLIRELLTQAPAKLNPGGALFLEIGYDQGERAAELCRRAFPNAHVEVLSDLAELDRVIIVRT